MSSLARLLAGILVVNILPQCISAVTNIEQEQPGGYDSHAAWAPITSFGVEDMEFATQPEPAPGQMDRTTFSSFKTKLSKGIIKEENIIFDKVEKVKEKVKKSIHIHGHKGGKEQKESDKAYIEKVVKEVKKIQEGFDAHNITEKLLASRLESAMMQSHAAKAAEASADGDAKPVCPPPDFKTQDPIDFPSFISGADASVHCVAMPGTNPIHEP
jgi:hypothetical protein